MATVVRVKRRLNEDPLDVLLLSHKKAKTENKLAGKDVNQPPESVLKFAGRVTSKDACISKHVREAIRKEKLEREYKQHQMNVLGHVKQESRRNQKIQSKQSRYKITAKHRAIDLDLLDQTKQEIEGTTVDSDKFSGNKDDKLKSTETDEIHSFARVNKDTNDVTSKNTERRVQGGIEKDVNIECECERTKSCKCKPSSDLNTNQIEEPRKSGGDEVMPQGKHKNSGKENDARLENKEGNGESPPKGAKEKMFCLVDVEAESENTVSYDTLCAESNLILCNGVPLEKEVVSERDSDESYVYDLYYTNNRDFDFGLLETDLTVEAFGQDYRVAEEDEWGEGGDEDDDSNDEGNWRNDYPDDDPGFIDNQDVGYYGNDLDENLAFETETGNQLADWMSWRCNIENEVELSSDDEVEDYEKSGKSYDGYYSRVQKEMEGDSDSDDLGNTYLDQL